MAVNETENELIAVDALKRVLERGNLDQALAAAKELIFYEQNKHFQEQDNRRAQQSLPE